MMMFQNNVCYTWALGDKANAEQALGPGRPCVELDLINQRLIPNAMEPRAAAAQWNALPKR